jgi:hypothetical protein
MEAADENFAELLPPIPESQKAIAPPSPVEIIDDDLTAAMAIFSAPPPRRRPVKSGGQLVGSILKKSATQVVALDDQGAMLGVYPTSNLARHAILLRHAGQLELPLPL